MKSIPLNLILAGSLILGGCSGGPQPRPARLAPARQTPCIFLKLPDYCPTPDGMAIAPDGSLVVACPNFKKPSQPGCLIKVDAHRVVQKWVDIPVLEKTGRACPMGIEFGPDGDIYVCDNQGWSGSKEGKNEGRILRLKIRDGKVEKMTVVAYGMEHPNGIRLRNGKLYVTQSLMTRVKDPSGLLVSGVYCFPATGEKIHVTNTRIDPNLITTLLTHNRKCQYGADGIVFDRAGNLYVGNFGDGSLHKITFDHDGNVLTNQVWARDPKELRTTDGMCIDSKGNIYVADFSENAVAAVTPAGRIIRMAQSPDCDGSDGGLAQPGEPIVWKGQLVVTCFDLVTGPDKVNKKHDSPYTISQLHLYGKDR